MIPQSRKRSNRGAAPRRQQFTAPHSCALAESLGYKRAARIGVSRFSGISLGLAAGLWAAASLAPAAFPSHAGAAEASACFPLVSRKNSGGGLSAIERNLLLFSAADEGCTGLAAELLAEGASVDARDSSGARPLTHAAIAGQSAIALLLLANRASIDARDLSGATALYRAIEAGRAALASELVERGADINIGGKDDVRPLSLSARRGEDGLMELLLAAGADPRFIDSTGKSAICYAAGRASAAIVSRLLDKGVDVNARYGNEFTALMWTAGHDERFAEAEGVKTANVLLERGAHVDDRDKSGRTALMMAAQGNHAAMIDLLLAKGADASLRDIAGKTAADLTTRAALKQRLQKS